MQKKLLLVAIAGALASPLAFAQGNVTISGRLAVGVESYKLSGPVAPTSSLGSELRVSDQSSNLVFSGSEDLGGGTKAWFQLDARVAPDLGGLNALGNTQVGLSGDGWGKLAIGRADLHYHELNVLGGWGRSSSLQSWITPGAFSQVAGVGIANTTRTPNVVLWDSPNWGGITARAAISTNAAANEGTSVGNASKDMSTNFVVRWTGGPMTAGVSLWEQKAEGNATAASLLTTTSCPALFGGGGTATTGLPFTNPSKGCVVGSAGDQSSQRAWFGWTSGPLKVGLGYDTSKIKTSLVPLGPFEAKRTALVVPLSFTFGSSSVHFNYAKMDKLDITTFGKQDDTDATAMSVGFDMNMSKRTSWGVSYAKVDNKAAAAYDLFAIGANGATPTGFGQDATQLYFGIAHFY